MNRIVLHCAALCTAVAALGDPAAAGGFDPSRVFGDARLVVHVDVEALRGSQLLKAIGTEPIRESLELDELERSLERELREAGLEPFEGSLATSVIEGVSAVTVACRSVEDTRGVWIVSADSSLDPLFALALRHPSHRSLSEDGLEVHTWTGGCAEELALYASKRGDERIYVFASDREELLHGVRALIGQESSAAGGAAVLSRRPRPGAFLFVEAAEVPWLSGYPSAHAARDLAQGLSLEVGESASELYAVATVQSASPEDALDLSAVLDGVRAFARLACGQEGAPPAARQWLDALNVNILGSAVEVELRYELQRLTEDLRRSEYY